MKHVGVTNHLLDISYCNNSLVSNFHWPGSLFRWAVAVTWEVVCVRTCVWSHGTRTMGFLWICVYRNTEVSPWLFLACERLMINCRSETFFFFLARSVSHFHQLLPNYEYNKQRLLAVEYIWRHLLRTLFLFLRWWLKYLVMFFSSEKSKIRSHTE